MHRTRKIWRTPWSYPESAILVGAVVAVGFVLQIATGGFDFRPLAYPVGLLLGGAAVLICVASAWFRDNRLVRWFSGVPMSVTLISALGILALIMGLTPQGAMPTGSVSGLLARLGFNAMISSWAFVLVYLVLLMSLGCLVARRLADFRAEHWAFYLNHIGLWIVLFAAGLGHADMQRHVMRVYEGDVEWTVRDSHDNVVELPIAIKLHDFDMEEYPSRMLVMDSVGSRPPTPYTGGAIEPGQVVVTARPEPKRFSSDIEVFNPDGTSKRGVTEVNHPFRMGSWMIYQYGYDSEAGRESSYSVMELVRDPWVGPVYTGFAMMALGAAAMVWNGASGGRRAERKRVRKQTHGS